MPPLKEIQEALERASRILICGHEDLDGDCIGSQLGLYHWLAGQGKEGVVTSGGPTLANYAFLPGYEQAQPRVPEGFTAEVSVCLDTGSLARILPGVKPQGLIINIDHHGGNTRYGDINWVEPEAAAVGEMIYLLLERYHRPLSPEVATCLYLAILTDTGSFRYAKTSARTFDAAAALVHAGARPYAVASAYYDNIHPDSVRMTGEVFSRLRFELGGRLVWGEITLDMYQRLGGLERQPEQLASQLRSLQGVEVAVLFHEMESGQGRASFRSRGRVDVNAMAGELGGGGHSSAAGYRFQGDYVSNRDRVLDVVRRYVAALPSGS